VDQNKFEELTKVLASEGPRRGLLGAIAGGALGVLFGVSTQEAEAGSAQRRRRRVKRQKRRAAQRKQQNRCRKVNRVCQPFDSGKCCSKRCCPALGEKANEVSVCAPRGISQCCPAGLGGGYCDRDEYRKCCAPTALSPDGFCCRSVGSSCCSANSQQATDYCCPPGSHCCDEHGGCCADETDELGTQSAPVPQAAGRKAG
jgi:hypothetical protein